MTTPRPHADHATHFARFKQVLNALDRDHMDLVEKIYAPKVVFQDPVNALKGRAALRAYLERLYANVTYCRFRIHHEAMQGDTAFVAWTMEKRHERFRTRETLCLDGMSMVVFDANVQMRLYHDSFDLGRMLYERLPIPVAVKHRIKGAL